MKVKNEPVPLSEDQRTHAMKVEELEAKGICPYCMKKIIESTDSKISCCANNARANRVVEAAKLERRK